MDTTAVRIPRNSWRYWIFEGGTPPKTSCELYGFLAVFLLMVVLMVAAGGFVLYLAVANPWGFAKSTFLLIGVGVVSVTGALTIATIGVAIVDALKPRVAPLWRRLRTTLCKSVIYT